MPQFARWSTKAKAFPIPVLRLVCPPAMSDALHVTTSRDGDHAQFWGNDNTHRKDPSQHFWSLSKIKPGILTDISSQQVSRSKLGGGAFCLGTRTPGLARLVTP